MLSLPVFSLLFVLYCHSTLFTASNRRLCICQFSPLPLQDFLFWTAPPNGIFYTLHYTLTVTQLYYLNFRTFTNSLSLPCRNLFFISANSALETPQNASGFASNILDVSRWSVPKATLL